MKIRTKTFKTVYPDVRVRELVPIGGTSGRDIVSQAQELSIFKEFMKELTLLEEVETAEKRFPHLGGVSREAFERYHNQS